MQSPSTLLSAFSALEATLWAEDLLLAWDAESEPESEREPLSELRSELLAASETASAAAAAAVFTSESVCVRIAASDSKSRKAPVSTSVKAYESESSLNTGFVSRGGKFFTYWTARTVECFSPIRRGKRAAT